MNLNYKTTITENKESQYIYFKSAGVCDAKAWSFFGAHISAKECFAQILYPNISESSNSLFSKDNFIIAARDMQHQQKAQLFS